MRRGLAAFLPAARQAARLRRMQITCNERPADKIEIAVIGGEARRRGEGRSRSRSWIYDALSRGMLRWV